MEGVPYYKIPIKVETPYDKAIREAVPESPDKNPSKTMR